MITEEQWQAIERLPRAAQREDVLDFLMTYVCYWPKRRRPDGQLKELKGEYKGLWQYDIDRAYRLIYSVDEDAKTVNIEYVGSILIGDVEVRVVESGRNELAEGPASVLRSNGHDDIGGGIQLGCGFPIAQHLHQRTRVVRDGGLLQSVGQLNREEPLVQR